ncbi:unnamed protein product [Gadus morhua 'NCC']
MSNSSYREGPLLYSSTPSHSHADSSGETGTGLNGSPGYMGLEAVTRALFRGPALYRARPAPELWSGELRKTVCPSNHVS